ncbi:hypothetical protein MRX96_059770 [Rhipicephalus microplus]
MAAKSPSELAGKTPVTVRSVFERPRYDKVMDPCDCAKKCPATNAVLAHVAGMDEALYRRTLESSTAAQVAWAKMDPYTRCTHLYNLARSVQKHLTSFGEMQSLQSGKVIPVCMEEASQMVRYLYHYAGVAMTLNECFPESTPRGVVVVLLEDVRATCPVSAWRVGEILAAGNSLLIIAKSECSLAPMHYAEMCAAGGLPPGLVNVLIGPFEGILGMDDVGHVHVVASHSRCRELRQSLALKPTTSLSSYWGCGRSIAVVLEGADLHSAAAGIGQSFANSSGRGEACGVQVFVQECVYAKFMPLLRKELRQLRVGAANDRTSDMSVVFAQGEPAPLPPKVAYAELPDAELLSAGPYDDKHPYPPRPALFADVTPSSPVVLDLVGWPLVLVTQFRTAKESVTLVNSALHHSEVSVWTERLPAALELAAAYKATTVFVNGQGLRDASVEFGSRAGVACGKRGLLTFVKSPGSSAELSSCASTEFNLEKYGVEEKDVSGKIGESHGDEFSTLTTYKLFVGGQQVRPASNASNAATSHDGRTVGYFPEAGRKDVRNAVEAALVGFKTWSSRSAHNRAQVLYYLAENLKMRATEMAGVLREMNGQTEADCRAEVDACIRRLFYWASMCDKDAGSVRSTTIKGSVIPHQRAHGSVALAAGNSVVVLASSEWPLPALHFCQILQASDIPPGVVNVLSAKEQPTLLRTLAEHHDVAAIWYYGEQDSTVAFLRCAISHNDKHCWVFPLRDDQDRYWMGWQIAQHAIVPKSIWLPFGDTFAN